MTNKINQMRIQLLTKSKKLRHNSKFLDINQMVILKCDHLILNPNLLIRSNWAKPKWINRTIVNLNLNFLNWAHPAISYKIWKDKGRKDYQITKKAWIYCNYKAISRMLAIKNYIHQPKINWGSWTEKKTSGKK